MSLPALYRGKEKKIVISFDVGVANSMVSYSLTTSVLDPGHIPKIININKSGLSIPTVIYYDNFGIVRAAGYEVSSDGFSEKAKQERYLKAERFSLHIKSSGNPLQIAPPLPLTKTVEQVFADYLQYLFVLACQDIKVQTAASCEINFVLTYPNGWESDELDKMRKAAVMAGLVPDNATGQSRILFVTQGEAWLQLSVYEKILPEITVNIGEGTVIVHDGSGMIYFNTYVMATDEDSERRYEEICSSQHENISVTINAKRFLENYLSDSVFIEDLEHIVDCFDKTIKKRFKWAEEPQYIKFGSLRDDDVEHEIRFGQLKLSGSTVAQFFQPSIDCIIRAVHDQVKVSRSRRNVTRVVMLGEFASHDWVFQMTRNILKKDRLTVVRFPTALPSASAGGIVQYLDNISESFTSAFSYGYEFGREYDENNPEHYQRREAVAAQEKQLEEGLENTVVKGNYMEIISKTTEISHTQEFSFPPTFTDTMDNFSITSLGMLVWYYRGNIEPCPRYIDMDKDNFKILCTLDVTLELTQVYGASFFLQFRKGIVKKAELVWYQDVGYFPETTQAGHVLIGSLRRELNNGFQQMLDIRGGII